MKPLLEYDKQSILAEEVFVELFSQEDEILRARWIVSLQDRAKELKCETQFKQLLQAYRKVAKTKLQQDTSMRENYTNFTGPYPRMKCRYWLASDEGIFRYKTNGDLAQDLACYHPILPVERMRNLETGEEKIKLAYKRGRSWDEIIVPKTVVASSRSIVQLAARGVAVTSENAKYLVQYLSDVENSNTEQIEVIRSTSKLGWHGNEFIPFDATDIVFDGDDRFSVVTKSVTTAGSSNVWYTHVKELRKTNRQEIKIALAASFGSVLISVINALPYIVDLWGETGHGKSITMSLATSIWADPAEKTYMGDFGTSDVGLEVKADLLNHLPLMLDDTSKAARDFKDKFETIVYNLCSGKGKTRSNKDLGIVRERYWKNSILTNGENPLSSYVSQGGAINRILEIECEDNVYTNPQETLDVILSNYGWAGRDFVETVKQLGADTIKRMQQEIYSSIADDSKMQKQSLALSVVLTADRIATDYLFHDGEYIDIKAAKKALVDKKEISDAERCYQFILSKIDMNRARFDAEINIEHWGELSGDYAYFYPQALEQLCKEGGFSKKTFLAWADKKKLLIRDAGHYTANMRIGADKRQKRCVVLRIYRNEKEDPDGFLKVEDMETSGQMNLPFT